MSLNKQLLMFHTIDTITSGFSSLTVWLSSPSFIVFNVVLCVLYFFFVSLCWSWSCLSSDFTISVCPFGSFEFRLPYVFFIKYDYTRQQLFTLKTAMNCYNVRYSTWINYGALKLFPSKQKINI